MNRDHYALIRYTPANRHGTNVNNLDLKKKVKKKKFLPTYPNFFGPVTGNRHIFLIGLIYILYNKN